MLQLLARLLQRTLPNFPGSCMLCIEMSPLLHQVLPFISGLLTLAFDLCTYRQHPRR